MILVLQSRSFETRHSVLQMGEETLQFNTERSEKIRQLHNRQSREIEAFDLESERLGFRILDLTEPPQEFLQEDDSSLSGSLLSLSLSHSSSSNSFSQQTAL